MHERRSSAGRKGRRFTNQSFSFLEMWAYAFKAGVSKMADPESLSLQCQRARARTRKGMRTQVPSLSLGRNLPASPCVDQ